MNRSYTLIIKLAAFLALSITFNDAHFGSKYGGPKHGPQVWPWWLLFSLSLIRLEIYAPSTGRRLWLYTRWGAVYWDFVLDRRGVIKKRVQWSVFKWAD